LLPSLIAYIGGDLFFLLKYRCEGEERGKRRRKNRINIRKIMDDYDRKGTICCIL
jgi:hypothetical protein